MTRHLFLSTNGTLRSNWIEAFPDAIPVKSVQPAQAADIVWLLLPNEGEIANLIGECRSALPDLPVIALSDTPRDEQGLTALGAGVSGYCNGYAAPNVLQQVADIVLNGGVWVGQSILQRLVAGTAQLAAQKRSAPVSDEWAANLTDRETIVAKAVASGANNKEIANQLDITERTVKAHLGSAFEKLKVRDRLQLTLLVNGIIKN